MDSTVRAAMNRHVELANITVTRIDFRYVLIEGIKTDGLAALQILNSAGEDTLTPESFAWSLSHCH